MSADDEPDILAAAGAEVERTREELGTTGEAFADKADVKARAKDTADEVRAKAADAVGEAKAKAEETTARVKVKAAQKVDEVRAEADDAAVQAKGTVRAVGTLVGRLPPAALAGIGVAAAGLVAVLRRRS